MKNINLNTKLELVDELDGEAFAAISLNPMYQWAKIVVTDDQPNANKHRVPLEEFDNIIKTGIFAPIKMAESGISRGHDEALGKPIGTITQLTKVNNRIIALAALWKKERPESIELLKEMYSKGTPPNVSWELSYAESKIETDEVEALYGISLTALTVVSAPAYTGRTPFVAMASSWSKEYIDKLPDTSFLYVKDGERYLPIKNDKGLYDINYIQAALENVDKLGLEADVIEQLKQKATNIITQIESALENISQEQNDKEDETVDNTELEQKVSSLETENVELKTKLQTYETELTTLRSYKESAEQEKATAQRLVEIKTRFSEAGLEKEDTFWTEKAETLLKLDDAALDFMIQELVSFGKTSEASTKKTEVPNFKSDKGSKMTPAELAKALRERNLSKSK